MGLYLQFLVILFMVTAGILYVMAMTGCDDDCDNFDESPKTTTTTSEKASFQGHIHAKTPSTTAGATTSGATVGRTLGGTSIGAGPSKVTYTYYPPPGATSFSGYEPSDQPLNPNGPPPYVWEDRCPDESIDVRFDLPSQPGTYSESLLSQHSDGSRSAAAMVTEVTSGSSSSSSDLPGGEIASNSVGAQVTADVWSVTPYIYTHDLTMTTQLCQDWLAFLKEDSAFLAARMPVTPTASTQSYPIPIVFGDVYSANLALVNKDTDTKVFTVPAEYRPERFTFLENKLPSASPGEHWVALGLSSSPPTSCPTLPELKPGKWELQATAYLDLGTDPRVLPIYFCYEGQSPPPGVSALQMAAARIASASGADIGITSYQDQGITCLGPKLLHLRDDADRPDLSLYGSSAHSISPTETITLHHRLAASTAMTVALDYACPLGITWDMYIDCHNAYPTPITSPIWVDTPYDYDYEDVCLAAHQVQIGAEDGPYTLVVTATSVMTPGISSTASDMLWVGAWVAPPGGDRDVYLPVVLRQSS